MAKKPRVYLNFGTRAAPDLKLIKQAIDISLDRTAGEGNANARDTDDNLSTRQKRNFDVQFGYRERPDLGTDEILNKLIDLDTTGDPIEVVYCTGDITDSGTRSWRAPCQLFGFQHDSPDEDEPSYSFGTKVTPMVEAGALLTSQYELTA